MTSLKLSKAVIDVIAQLAQEPSVLEIWLIGSRANDSAKFNSDWDILIFSTADPYPSPVRHPEVDVLWTGPSERVLLEGQPICMEFAFSDFQWITITAEKANYSGRKSLDHAPGVARDVTEPAQVRVPSSAIRVWYRYPESRASHA